QTYSAGLGYRSKKFFTDLTASYKQFNSIYAPYILENPNDKPYLDTSFVETENSNLNFVLTFGLFF
ncbi:MAG: hypothetical protein KAI29_20520, partial [Cyclobacteriaceae bacterium]|nr:hypothetical protein [Cyclobacteriaceae bacterium]